MDETDGSTSVQEILRFNQGRDVRRLALKYAAMRRDAFGFLRGSCHLFYGNLPADAVLAGAPLTWISGDLHLENFGCYKGDNRLAYFDINDFDEACLAPCSWDLLRFLTSVLIGAATLAVSERQALGLCRSYLAAYAGCLRDGKPRWIERAVAQGMLRDLLRDVKRFDRRKLLKKRTRLRHGRRVFRVPSERALETTAAERKQVKQFMQAFAREQEQPRFFRVLDVADRIAGNGSLGVRRYVVLVEGHGTDDGNFLLDIKEAIPSSAAAQRPPAQPAWKDEAERVVTLQRQIQAIPPALLSAVTIGKRPFVLKELQPVEHRANLAAWDGKFKRLELAVINMAQLTAWGHLRAAGWRGAAAREELCGYGADGRWAKGLLELARQHSRAITGQWREFCTAYDDGVVERALE